MWIFFVLAGILLLLIVSGGFTFFVACVRKKELPWLDEEKLKKTPYGQFSDHIQKAHQWLSEQKAQPVTITSEDGLKLAGLWVPAEDAKGTILLAHGYCSSFLVDFGPVMEHYHKQGLNLLLPYQRSHGKSEGRYITFGVLESKDMMRWIDYHNSTFGKLPMILSGLSMGASTVMYMADEPLPENVRGIIVDCGFTSPKEIIADVFRKVTHLPATPAIWVANLFARVFAGFSLTQKDSRKTLTKNRLPIIMVHGMADDFVPCDMTRQGYQVCTGEKQQLLVEEATHGVSYFHAKERYTTMVNEFIKKTLAS